MLKQYHTEKRPGAIEPEEPAMRTALAPPPGAAGRNLWKPKVRAFGPIALLMESLWQCAAWMQPGGTLQRAHDAPINLWTAPAQEITRSIAHWLHNVRAIASAQCRKVLTSMQSCDKGVTTKYLLSGKCPPPAMLQRIMADAMWSSTRHEQHGHKELKGCPLCASVTNGPRHIWHCTHPDIVAAREADERLCKYLPDPSILPDQLAVAGLAGEMTADPEAHWWFHGSHQERELSPSDFVQRLVQRRSGRAPYAEHDLRRRERSEEPTARRAIMLLREQVQYHDDDHVFEVSDYDPSREQLIGYTDGTVTPPRWRHSPSVPQPFIIRIDPLQRPRSQQWKGSSP